MVARFGFSVALGVVATFVLFLVMQALIKSDKSPFDESIQGRIVDFVRVEEEMAIETKLRKPKPPPPPDEPPPNKPKATFDASSQSQGIDISQVNVDVELSIDHGAGFSSDGEYLPIVKVAPVYPRRAQTRGIEGYVLLEFVVTRTGAVRDPVVLESKPPGIFDRAALNAALKFKYKPKVVNGEPIDVAGVRNRITFELQDN